MPPAADRFATLAAQGPPAAAAEAAHLTAGWRESATAPLVCEPANAAMAALTALCPSHPPEVASDLAVPADTQHPLSCRWGAAVRNSLPCPGMQCMMAIMNELFYQIEMLLHADQTDLQCTIRSWLKAVPDGQARPEHQQVAGLVGPDGHAGHVLLVPAVSLSEESD